MNIILLAAALLISNMVFAEAKVDSKDLAQKVIAAKSNLEDQEKKSRQILSALYQIQVKMKSNVKKKTKLLEQKAQLQLALDRTQKELAQQELLVSTQKNLLGQRIKSVSQIKGQSLFQILFSSQSPHQLDKNMKILGLIAERDVRLIGQYHASVKVLNREKQLVLNRIEKMKSVEADLQNQDKNFALQQASRKIILDRFQRNKKNVLRKLEVLRQASLQQDQGDLGLLDPILKPSFLEKKGQLAWPLTGEVKQKFGLEKKEGTKLQLYNKGIFIKAAKGSPVNAVAEGKVIFTGDLQGLGRTVIIDHGDHFYSVYSNTEEIFVNSEASVHENQKIASVSEAAFSAEPGLYFEIRHFSEPTDPVSWMKGNTL